MSTAEIVPNNRFRVVFTREAINRDMERATDKQNLKPLGVLSDKLFYPLVVIL